MSLTLNHTMPIGHCIYAVETNCFHRGWQQGALKACNSLVDKSITFRHNKHILQKLFKVISLFNSMESDTKPENVKCCSRCNETKEFDTFIKKRNLCKECVNKSRKEQYRAIVINENVDQTCESCDLSKPSSSFIKNKLLCKECNNKKRREKYKNDEDHRQKMINQASTFKHNKVVEKQKKKLDEIGEGNKKCSWCDEIKPGCKFRYNRLKCRNCERDDPLERFKRNVRSRIFIALKGKKLRIQLST